MGKFIWITPFIFVLIINQLARWNLSRHRRRAIPDDPKVVEIVARLPESELDRIGAVYQASGKIAAIKALLAGHPMGLAIAKRTIERIAAVRGYEDKLK